MLGIVQLAFVLTASDIWRARGNPPAGRFRGDRRPWHWGPTSGDYDGEGGDGDGGGRWLRYEPASFHRRRDGFLRPESATTAPWADGGDRFRRVTAKSPVGGDPVVVYGTPVLAPEPPKVEPVTGARNFTNDGFLGRLRHSQNAENHSEDKSFFRGRSGSVGVEAGSLESNELISCRALNGQLSQSISKMDQQIFSLERELVLVRIFLQKLIEEQQTSSDVTNNRQCSPVPDPSSEGFRKGWAKNPTILFKLVQVILGVILMVLQRKYRIVPSLTDEDAILLVQITYAAFLIITPPLLLSYLTSAGTQQYRPLLHGSLAEVIYLLVGAIMFLSCGASFIHNWINFKPDDIDGGLIDKLPLDVVPPELPLPFDVREIKTDLKRYREAALALGGMSVANGIFYFLDSWIVVYNIKSFMH